VAWVNIGADAKGQGGRVHSSADELTRRETWDARHYSRGCRSGDSIEAMDDDWSLYPVLDASDRKRLARTANDVVRETVSAREWRRFPQYAVAFAGNGTGDQLVFVPSQADRSFLEPKVYLWSHETGELSLVADDVSQLECS